MNFTEIVGSIGFYGACMVALAIWVDKQIKNNREDTQKTIDILREEGKKVGLLKIRLYRPFPGEEIAQALRGVKVIGIMDRAEGMSSQGGPLGADVKSALFDNNISAKAMDFIYGLGGRDVRVENIIEVFEKLEDAYMSRNFSTYEYLSVRE